MMDSVEPEPASKKQKKQIEPAELAAAKARAARETAEPGPTNFFFVSCAVRLKAHSLVNKFSATRQMSGAIGHNQSWTKATVIPPARITFAIQQENSQTKRQHPQTKRLQAPSVSSEKTHSGATLYNT